MTPDEVRKRNALLDDLIVKQGRAPGDVKRTMMKAIFCGRNEAEYEARLRGPRRNPANDGVPTGELLDGIRTRTKAIIGTPDEVVAQIQSYADAGIEEIMAQFLVVDDLDGLRVLAEEVLPRLH
jgi:alkanesulfonate monooxygenase SsuD/methylene tetrahydromethanopterin reductase-like flavin-dependent oxidoreductase (luciferase family)